MKPVLLLIDLQNDFLSTPDLAPATGSVVRCATVLLGECRRLRIPVVHVWTTVNRKSDERLPHWRVNDRWICVAGTFGHASPDSLLPIGGEPVVHKSGFNAFARGTLDRVLETVGCDSLILAGVHLHTCVRIAATEALERQLKVFVAEDATGSNDPIHAAAVRRWLMERTVRFAGGTAVLQQVRELPARVEHRSPSDVSEVLFDVPIPTASDITAAVSTAEAGWKRWRQTPLLQRAELLSRFITVFGSAGDRLAQQIASDIGKPRSQAREELSRGLGNSRDVIQRALKLELTREKAGIVRHEPLGVIAVVSPWNNPVAIPIGKIIPALIYGNSVVWKPSPAATRIAELLLHLLNQAGVPRDVLRLLPGDHTTAQALAAHEKVEAVTFTGALMGGHAMQEICSRRLIPLQAELSGNNAAIVWRDADLPRAASLIASGAFAFSGQRCTANRRVIVPEELFEPLLAELRLSAERLVLGNPHEGRTDIGPLISAGKRDEVESTIRAAADGGQAWRIERTHARVAGEIGFKTGAYMQPAMVGCDQPQSPLVQEESMAPVLVVQRARDFDHALALANGVRHGLIAALFSNAPELQQQFLAEARAGILKLNSATAGVDVTLPFGGWKASHIGPPEHGAGDLLFYTRMQTLYGFEPA